MAHLYYLNAPGREFLVYAIRKTKYFALIGGYAAIMMERFNLEKRWTYYDRFYPEATTLQKTLTDEAYNTRINDANASKLD